MNLVKGLEHKNYDVYMDNYYTSVQLFLALADKGNWCMWHKYKQIASSSQRLLLWMKWNASQEKLLNDSLLSMLWKGRESILFLLSIHQPKQGEPAKRKVKLVNIYQETEFLCPKLVNGYNKFMGGVDYND